MALFWLSVGLGAPACLGQPGARAHTLPPHAVHVNAGGTCAIIEGGRVKCWGKNHRGQLGLGDTRNRGDDPDEMGDRLPFVELGAGRRALQLAGGYTHTCALLEEGSVKCWGSNHGGLLGLGDTEWRGDEPIEMGDALPVIDLGTEATASQIAAGRAHTCALLSNGSVKCWGNNGRGQLGLGDTEDRGDSPGEMGDALSPVDLGPQRQATHITASGEHTCALLEDGSVKCWGANSAGQLGLGDTNDRGDDPGEMGDALLAVDLGAGRRTVDVAAGGAFTCALLDDQSVKCWGFNAMGSLGQGDREDRGDRPGELGDALPAVRLGDGLEPVQLEAGSHFACARFGNGTIKCWGRQMSI